MSLFPADIRAKYEVLEKLGEGGIGQVYKVRHRQLDELRVVKVIHAHYADDLSVRQRFRREAKAATNLRHPNIAQIHDFHIGEDGRAYLVMELIEGLTVGQLIAYPKLLPVDLLVELGMQGLDALGYLHGRGYLHRDVTPDNLMVTRSYDGRPQMKLIDLGLAKRHQETLQVTATNMFVGTVRYASPERFRRPLATEPVPSSDLYSFGIVLYELLTGVCPVRGSSFEELMAAHLLDEPPPFEDTDLDGRLNDDLRRVLLKALAKNPLDRYRSAEAFAQELGVHRPVEPPAVDVLEPLFERRRRRLAAEEAARLTSLTTLAGGGPDPQAAGRPKNLPGGRLVATPTLVPARPGAAPRPRRRWRRVALVAAAVAVGVVGLSQVDWLEVVGGSPVPSATPTAGESSGSDGEVLPLTAGFVGQARLVVSARPWAEIVSVVNDEGDDVLDGPRYTPALFRLPAGSYRVELRHPGSPEPQTFEVQVPIVGTVQQKADFGGVAIDDFFAQLGVAEALSKAGS